ncbi:DUF3857 domain-containing protein [Flavobacterium jejuense]|uniref:DUF3857 domain-containing protein n=1 Tax=Flavobacterium jejuense TaxID=1544455 RepID=A0ABX0ILV1_9FLAO|nr:DUF3857 domain-containing protein [Flavobacterium jejuense]NHN24698.1 DUF3857 domain-containing protein [Flavobacterium jejuense]
MKYNYLFLLLFCFSITNAQKKEEIKNLFWNTNDEFGTIVAVPEKYKNESAVIIYKNENYDFHKFGKSVTYTSSVRKRIKLQDQAAVTEFSEFSFKDRFYSNKGFSFKKGTITLGIKIIKPDGKEIEIDVNKESVEEDESKKVAISNLEVGDIIDFYYHSVEPFKSSLEFGFEPVETTLGESYPILDLKITFETENDFFVNFNSYNGAPELKKIETKKSNERKYVLSASDVAKNDFPRWFLPLVELPCYKFQVFFARSGKFEQRADAFLSDKESDIKKTVSKEDILDYYNTKFYPSGNLNDVNDFLKGKSFSSDEEKIKEIYYFTRHQFYTRYIEAYILGETKIMSYPYALYDSYPIFFNSEEQFIRYFMAYLKKNDINYDIIVATGRENGPIKDILIQQNARVLLKINTAEPIYFGIFTPYSLPNQFDTSLENTNAYALKVSKNKKVTDIEEVKLPTSTNDDNVSKVALNVAFDVTLNTLKINKETSLFGNNKSFEQSDKMNFYDYITEDYEKYGTTPLLDLVRNKKMKEKYRKEYDALLQKMKDKQKESLKKAAEREYNVKVDDFSFEIVNTGRYGETEPFQYKENFTIKDDFIKKAGPNFIIEIGKLIDSQVEIEEKEYKRENNIYTSFPRAFNYKIEFSIPEGYSVTGLEKLNKTVENETGSFISKASIIDSKLHLEATKKYSHSYEPVANWQKMIAFLDAAYQLTQEKILLKKN